MGGSLTSTRSFKHIVRTSGLAAVDVVALYSAFVGAYVVRAAESKPLAHYVSLAGFCELAAVLVPAWMLVLAACGLYSDRQSRARMSEAARIGVAVSIGVMLLIVADYLNTGAPLFPGKAVPLYALILGVVFVMLGRLAVQLAMQVLYARERGLHNIVIVGTGPVAERLAIALEAKGQGNRIVAAVSPQHAGSTFAHNLPVYATLEQALDGHRVRIDEIVQADVHMDRSEVVRHMSIANERGLGYRFVPDLYGVFAAASTVSTVAGVPMMEVRLTSLDGWATVGKRVIDIVGSLVALVLLAPLFLVIAAAVKLSDPAGPVFYQQARLGRGGRRIGVLKFRSMKWEYSTGPDRPYKTALEAFEAMGRSDLCAEFVVQQKVANDPRVSKLGVFLRRTSLDELPQLINSLRGDVSLVGPRPITSEELDRYGERRASFLALKPGITGLWQVSGRSDTGYDERVQLDVYYAENWSPMLDFTIMARTVVTVAARRGAY